jgi:predicted site-specific integrase-resolvase
MYNARFAGIKEAAASIGVAVGTLYHWIETGKLTSKHGLRRLARSIRFDLDALRSAIAHGDLAKC